MLNIKIAFKCLMFENKINLIILNYKRNIVKTNSIL